VDHQVVPLILGFGSAPYRQGSAAGMAPRSAIWKRHVDFVHQALGFGCNITENGDIPNRTPR